MKTNFFTIANAILIVILMLIFDSYVLTKLWSWFVVPIFKIGEISLGQSYGFTLFVHFLLRGLRPERNEIASPTLESSIVKLIVRPFATLFVGFLIKTYLL